MHVPPAPSIADVPPAPSDDDLPDLEDVSDVFDVGAVGSVPDVGDVPLAPLVVGDDVLSNPSGAVEVRYNSVVSDLLVFFELVQDICVDENDVIEKFDEIMGKKLDVAAFTSFDELINQLRDDGNVMVFQDGPRKLLVHKVVLRVRMCKTDYCL